MGLIFSNQITLSPKGGARTIWSYNWTYVISGGNINFYWIYSHKLIFFHMRNVGTAVDRRPSFIKRLVFPHFAHQPFYAGLNSRSPALKVAKDCIKIKLTDGELKGIWYCMTENDAIFIESHLKGCIKLFEENCDDKKAQVAITPILKIIAYLELLSHGSKTFVKLLIAFFQNKSHRKCQGRAFWKFSAKKDPKIMRKQWQHSNRSWFLEIIVNECWYPSPPLPSFSNILTGQTKTQMEWTWKIFFWVLGELRRN